MTIPKDLAFAKPRSMSSGALSKLPGSSSLTRMEEGRGGAFEKDGSAVKPSHVQTQYEIATELRQLGRLDLTQDPAAPDAQRGLAQIARARGA